MWLQCCTPHPSCEHPDCAPTLTTSLTGPSVDDVEDNSVLRRGVPVAHSIFGVAQAINTANYVYFLALGELAKLENPEYLSIYTGSLSLRSQTRALMVSSIQKNS